MGEQSQGGLYLYIISELFILSEDWTVRVGEQCEHFTQDGSEAGLKVGKVSEPSFAYQRLVASIPALSGDFPDTFMVELAGS